MATDKGENRIFREEFCYIGIMNLSAGGTYGSHQNHQSNKAISKFHCC